MPKIPYFIFKMFNKKAQAEIRELIITLVVVGAIAIVGVLIFSAVKNTGDSLLSADILAQVNETVNITMFSGSDNSTLLTRERFILNSESVANATNASKILVRGTDYNISLASTDGGLTGSSGAIGTRANLSFLGLGEAAAYNITEVKVTYDYNSESAAQASINVVSNTVLDSYELGVISLIVFAAIVILAILFKLGSQ